MSGKKQSFKDILRDSFPVNVDGLLGGLEKDHPAQAAVATEDTVPQQATAPPTETVSRDETVCPNATIASSATVPHLHTVPPVATVSSLATVSHFDPASPSEQVELTSNYFRIDADVFDILPRVQTPFEQLVYRHLYRESYGRNSRTCFVGLKALTDISQLSKNTVRRALDSLQEKGHIRRMERFNDRDHKGTVYRVFLPSEIPGLQSRTTFTLIGD